MPGLADIGRAKPFSSLTGGLLENAQGLFRTQVSMDQMAQQRRSQDIQDRLNTMKMNEAQAATDRDNRLIYIDEIPTKFAASGQGEFGKAVHGYIKATGAAQEITSPDGSVKYFVRKGDMKEALNEYPKIMDKYPDFAKSMLWAQYTDSNAQLEALQQKMAKVKPEEADALKQQMEEAKGKRDQAIRAYNAFSGKGDTKELTPAWKPIADSNSPTGISYQDQNTGKMGGPAPQPQQHGKEYKQYVGTTPDAKNAIVFDARAGKFTTEPLPGGELPGVKGKKPLPATEASTLAQLNTTRQDIKLAKEAWDEGLTGAFQGQTNEALQSVRNHPAFEKLRRRVARLITVAYSLSGKQISKEELQLLQTTILPQVKQMDQNFLVALNELEGWIDRNGRNKEDAFTKAYYQFDPIFGGGSGTPGPVPAQGGRFKIIEVK